MAISLYLAMTSAEISAAKALPEKIAYMACHFSPYSTGLSNIPDALPPGSVLILNDRTPISGHDPELIALQLEQAAKQLQCGSILLDFQRGGYDELTALCKILIRSLPCPIAVSALYADGLECPVFVPPCPPHSLLSEYLYAWRGRDIWLEAALDSSRITVTESGCAFRSNPVTEGLDFPHSDEALHCHYRTDIADGSATFTLIRTEDDLAAFLQEAESLGIRKALGLWQELKPGNTSVSEE